MAAKTKSPEFAGVVTRVKLNSRKPYDPYIGRYSPNTEYDEFYLDIAVRLDDGRVVYFNTPPALRAVANCPGAAVVTFDLEGEAAKWLVVTGEVAVATPDRAADRHVEPTVKEGDRVVFTARIKAEKVSKTGNPYRVLNYVRRK